MITWIPFDNYNYTIYNKYIINISILHIESVFFRFYDFLETSIASLFIRVPSSGPEARHARQTEATSKIVYTSSFIVNHRPTDRSVDLLRRSIACLFFNILTAVGGFGAKEAKLCSLTLSPADFQRDSWGFATFTLISYPNNVNNLKKLKRKKLIKNWFIPYQILSRRILQKRY